MLLQGYMRSLDLSSIGHDPLVYNLIYIYSSSQAQSSQIRPSKCKYVPTKLVRIAFTVLIFQWITPRMRRKNWHLSEMVLKLTKLNITQPVSRGTDKEDEIRGSFSVKNHDCHQTKIFQVKNINIGTMYECCHNFYINQKQCVCCVRLIVFDHRLFCWIFCFFKMSTLILCLGIFLGTFYKQKYFIVSKKSSGRLRNFELCELFSTVKKIMRFFPLDISHIH